MMQPRYARRARAVMVFLVAAVCLPALVRADAVTVGNPNWYQFAFGGPGSFGTNGSSTIPSSGGNSEPAPDVPWTFSSATPVQVNIADAYNKGDSFTLFNFGVLVGSTPGTAFADNEESDPAVTSADPSWSSGTFVVPAGNASLTIRADASPSSAGGAYFRLSPVPEPATATALAAAGLLLATRRRRA